MTWKPVVVGVDPTVESATAVNAAWTVAQRAGVKCRLVHGVRDVRGALLTRSPLAAEELHAKVLDALTVQITRALQGTVPAAALATLEFRTAKAPEALVAAVHDHDAGLVVLGGKHHSALDRWFGGSTALNAVRRLDVPVLVTAGAPPPFSRVLVAVDLSYAARPTIETAVAYASLFGAQLRAVHALEPVPVLPEGPPMLDPHQFRTLTEQRLAEDIWPLLPPAAERAVLHGTAAGAIARDARELHADLVVLGSHGKGWWDRLLIGSVTERLLNELPAAVLVVPVPAPFAGAPAIVGWEYAVTPA